MVRYFILIKRTNSKRWLGAIPAKKGIALQRLRRLKTKKGFSMKVVSEAQLKRLISRLKVKSVGKKTRRVRRTTRRKTKRRPVKRRVRKRIPRRRVRKVRRRTRRVKRKR